MGTLLDHDGVMVPTLDSFTNLSTGEMIVLGLLWKYYSEVEPSPEWAKAREVAIASISPEDGADIRSAYASRSQREPGRLPAECYSAVQWSFLIEREKDGMPKSAYKSAMRAWAALSTASLDDTETIAGRVIIDDDGFFDLSGDDNKPVALGLKPIEPDWEQIREHDRLTSLLRPVLPS